MVLGAERWSHDPVALTTTTFVVTLVFFHASELLLVFTYERARLSFRSLLLSPPYLFAMAFSLLELATSLYFAPHLKRLSLRYAYWPGVMGVLCGEVLRKLAWCTAKFSFSHEIRTKPEQTHKLITHGVYKYARHPAYLGWFIWALSTQVLLANPVSLTVFTYATWTFFKRRIPFEEAYLVRFFGLSYLNYREITPTRIPGIP